MSTFKIKSGKRYYRRDEMLSGLIIEVAGCEKWRFKDLSSGFLYKENGAFSEHKENAYDLVRPESIELKQPEMIAISIEEYTKLKNRVAALESSIKHKNEVMREILNMLDEEVEAAKKELENIHIPRKKSPLLRAVSESVIQMNGTIHDL